MRILLENAVFTAEIESFGAELKSLVRKEGNMEYMWEADPAFWGKTSPILFPFIGKLEGGKYQYNDIEFVMDKHGFARDMDFTVLKQEADQVVFTIKSNENTLQKYPFTFALEVEYQLTENGIIESLRVINQDEKTMYFSFGGHPAFACPVKTGTAKKRTEYAVKLYGAEGKVNVLSTEIGVPDGLLTGKNIEIKLDNGVFPITDGIFDQDALCLAQQHVRAVGLLDENGREYIRLEADCPVWGIWSMPDSNAGYVCIEPWWGICDPKGYQGTLQQRPYTNQAEAGKTWECSYRIFAGKQDMEQGKMLQRSEAISFCLTLENVYEDYPFHDVNWCVMRHQKNQKVFAWIFDREDAVWINVKCSPEWRDFWRQTYPSILPAYHLNKEHWNSIILDGTVPEEEIKRMICESYDLTAPKNRKKKK